MEDIDNAETALNCVEQCVDFHTDRVTVGTIADDIVFIMENAVIHENETESLKVPDIKVCSSSSSSEDSDSDVQIVKVTQKTREVKGNTVCITSSDDECQKDAIMKAGKEKRITKTDSRKDEIAVTNLLKQVVVYVERICNGEVEVVYDNAGESSSDPEDEETKKNLISIICDEERVADNIPKVRNEILPEELPEEDDTITLTPEDNLLQIGVVTAIVETMIVIEASHDSPALDSETAFFLDQETFLGKVFDTFGPVKTPFYSVRLSKKIDKSEVRAGRMVYFVPFNQNITKYIFVEQLKRLKGSDASWKDDCEPPPECIDYSDDDEEQRARKELRDKKKEQRSAQSTDPNNNRQTAGQKRPLKPGRYGNALMEHALQTNNGTKPSKLFDSGSNYNQQSNVNGGGRHHKLYGNNNTPSPGQTQNSQHSRGHQLNKGQFNFSNQIPLDSYCDSQQNAFMNRPQYRKEQGHMVLNPTEQVQVAQVGQHSAESAAIQKSDRVAAASYSSNVQNPLLPSSPLYSMNNKSNPRPRFSNPRVPEQTSFQCPPVNSTGKEVISKSVNPYLKSFAELVPKHLPQVAQQISHHQAYHRNPTAQMFDHHQEPPQPHLIPYPPPQPQSYPPPQPQSYPSPQPQSYPSSQPQSYPSPQPQSYPPPQPQSYPPPQPQSYPSPQPQSYPSPQPQSYPSPQPQGYPSPQPQGYPPPQPQGYPPPQPQSYPSPQPQSYLPPHSQVYQVQPYQFHQSQLLQSRQPPPPQGYQPSNPTLPQQQQWRPPFCLDSSQNSRPPPMNQPHANHSWQTRFDFGSNR